MALYVRKTDWHPALEQLAEREQRLFACDCAEHVLHYFENLLSDDRRIREAIEVARQFAHGNASQENLQDAKATAEAAAWEASNVAYSDEPGSFAADAAASAAAATEAACWYGVGDSLWSSEAALEAAKSAANIAIEVVEIAAVGSDVANQIWTKGWDAVNAQWSNAMGESKALEEDWQNERIISYVNQNKQGNRDENLHSDS